MTLARRHGRAAVAIALTLMAHAAGLAAQGVPAAPEDSVRAAAEARGQALLSADTVANTGTFRGFPFRGKIRYTRVFVRRDGRWQAVTMQQTSMQ